MNWKTGFAIIVAACFITAPREARTEDVPERAAILVVVSRKIHTKFCGKQNTDEKAVCLKDLAAFWAEVDYLLSSALGRDGRYEFTALKEVKRALADYLKREKKNLLFCLEGIQCLQFLTMNLDATFAFRLSITDDGGERTMTLERYSADLQDSKGVSRTYRIGGAIANDNFAVSEYLKEMVGELEAPEAPAAEAPPAEALKPERDPACVTLQAQFETNKRRDPAFAVREAETALEKMAQCANDAQVLLRMARVLLELSKSDPFALSRAVDYYIRINGNMGDLDERDKRRVAKQVELFAKNYFPVMVLADTGAGWENPSRLQIEATKFINKGDKGLLQAFKQYFAERDVDLPIGPLYFPRVEHGKKEIRINGCLIQLAPEGIVTQIKVGPPLDVEGEPLGVTVTLTGAAAGGWNEGEGALTRADLSIRYSNSVLGFGPVSLSPRLTLGTTRAIGGFPQGGKEGWSHLGAGILAAFRLPFGYTWLVPELVVGADVLYSLSLGLELDLEIALRLKLPKSGLKDFALAAGFLRPVTFWEGNELEGAGFGLLHLEYVR